MSDGDEDATLESFLTYCSSRKIFISSALRPQYSPKSGLGLHAVAKIRNGQQLINVPTASILTTASIPASFIPDATTREKLTVHGLLATWLAFADERNLRDNFGPWMDSWPDWNSFRDTMPMFWESQPLLTSMVKQKDQPRETNDRQNTSKRRKTSSGTVSSCSGATDGTLHSRKDFAFSPAVDGHWLTLSSDHACTAENSGLLDRMVEKVRRILETLSSIQDQLGFDIMSPTCREQYIKFLHMWCCVNTRCFYYVPARTKAPEDVNEAMALVPFLDLFNHATDSAGASVKYDRKGFHVRADREYQAGEEIYVQYGKHSTDTLWTEYGFVLEQNQYDELDISALILQQLNKTQQAALKKQNYLGGNLLRPSEVCYRTEIAAWLVSGALGQHNWERMTQGMFTVESMPKKNYDPARIKMKRQIVDWLLLLRQECVMNVQALLQIENNTATLTQTFTPSSVLLNERSADAVEEIGSVAQRRYNMCLARWRGIYKMCMGAIQGIQAECSSAYLTGAADRSHENLTLTWEELVAKHGRLVARES